MLVGTPNMLAITCAGICCAYSTAMSASFLLARTSMSSRHHARVNTSSSSTARGANAGRIWRRVHVCMGASTEIGAAGDGPYAPEPGASAGGTTMISRDEKRCGSRAIAVTSSYVVGNHEPPHLSVCAMGHPSRRSSQIGNGFSMYSLLKMSYSVVQSIIPVMVSPSRDGTLPQGENISPIGV